MLPTRMTGPVLLVGLAAAQVLLPGQVASQAATGGADEILTRAAERYGKVESLCARFQQVLEVPLLDQTTRSAGLMCQRQPNLFNMAFSEPEGDLLVVDGEQVWMFYPSVDDEQVVQSELRGSTAQYDFYREFLENPTEKYDSDHEGRTQLEGIFVDVLALIPRASLSYHRARLWVDGEGLIRRIEIHENNESVRTLDFSAIELNPALDPDLFRFTPPDGVRVVRMPS